MATASRWVSREPAANAWSNWVCGLVAPAAVPVAFLLVRRTEIARGRRGRRATEGPGTRRRRLIRAD
jgi:hypothetical protein